ncbi:adhesin [Cutibacterium sp.]|uniref:adhesin n=1 Tax=Cutibacterium sp. TaxID=1912221 RepID=UPI0026DBEFCF|nr:adhesin [Cutibacterium sp.]MDO4412164.1 adhesin [Cutibacterium sp.]
MTTHNSTTRKQYRRAPLNGLIIGAIVGFVWPTVFAILHVRETQVIPSEEYPAIFTMSFIFPLIGWLTGLWEQKTYACDDPKKRILKTQIIGVVMATFANILMFSTKLIFERQDILLYIKAAVHPFSLLVFPCAGLILSDIGIRLKNSKAPFILSMSIASVVILFIAAVVWYDVFLTVAMFLSFHS